MKPKSKSPINQTAFYDENAPKQEVQTSSTAFYDSSDGLVVSEDDLLVPEQEKKTEFHETDHDFMSSELAAGSLIRRHQQAQKRKNKTTMPKESKKLPGITSAGVSHNMDYLDDDMYIQDFSAQQKKKVLITLAIIGAVILITIGLML